MMRSLRFDRLSLDCPSSLRCVTSGRSLRVILVVAACVVDLSACREAAPRPSGGELRIVLRSEPRTFNPVVALDAASATLVSLMHAELFRVDVETQDVVPELAERLDGPDSRGAVVVTLRSGVRFPDGEPFGSDDVVFSLTVAQDPAVGAPQLQALRLNGRPAVATALDNRTVRIEFGAVHADPARLLTSAPMLPRHRLEPAYREGRLTSTWGLSDAPDEIVGLGPFRLERYEPGVRVALVRNPAYWRGAAGRTPLPQLDRITATVVADADAQVVRLLAGDVDLLSAIDTRSHRVIAASAGRARVRIEDLGPSLEFTFLVLNLDDTPSGRRRPPHHLWFRDPAFRKALSAAIDRAAIARLVYDGRATPLGGHVSPGNRRWSASLPAPAVSAGDARAVLAAAGYSWDGGGRLIDAAGTPVSFSLLTSTSNPQRQRIASVVHDDLAKIGVDVRVAALEFRAYLERLTRTRDFDAAIMGLGGGDTDPNTEAGLWQLDGSTHVWRLKAPTPLAPWEADLDRLFREQAAATNIDTRRRLFNRLQELVVEHLPIVPLVSPNHLVAVRQGLEGLVPGVTSRDSLWNADEIAWASAPR